MKKNCLLLIVAASFMMCGCLKDLDISTTTTYTGRVLNANNVPVSNARVAICTYYTHSDAPEHLTTYTDATGHFSMTLDYRMEPSNIESHFLDYGIVIKKDSKRINLPLAGIGQETYDYGIIILE